MMETACFAVVPSLGALVPGHSLVCPKRHIRSFSRLSVAEYAEFQRLKDHVSLVLNILYGSGVHIFEHGMAAEGHRVPCTVDHAHMHFLPLPDKFDIDTVARLDWFRVERSSIESISKAADGSEYIYYEDAAGVPRMLRAGASGLESQYMRKLVASTLSYDAKWNWRDHPDASGADAAWHRFASIATEIQM